MTVKFVDGLPPSQHSIRLGASRIATTLKERPGTWAEIKRYSGKRKQAGYVYAHNCKMGKNKTLDRRLGFEVIARADGFGMVIVYARYVGVNGEHSEPGTSSPPLL